MHNEPGEVEEVDLGHGGRRRPDMDLAGSRCGPSEAGSDHV